MSEPSPAVPVDPALQALEAAYRTVSERMRGLPICNPRLDIALVGFRQHEGRWTGVAITPWFMNIVVLPAAGDAPPAHGFARPHHFPAGTVSLLGGALEGVGDVESHSLFSPMDEFVDMPHALAVAEAAVQALFTPPAPEAEAAGAQPATPAAPEAPAPPPAEPASPQMLSRRALFGRLARRE
jgi:[NiFe] hydrogenase assembly HybE family chaperone